MHTLYQLFVLTTLIAGSIGALRTINLATVVRDFKANPQSGYHPDFEQNCGDERGLVGQYLSPDGKPWMTKATGVTIRSNTTFAQWYRDVDGVNIHLDRSITLTETSEGSGVYGYRNTNYFPIDGAGWAPGYYQSSGHNFHFTTEITSEFTYVGGETFTFIGDDDVWVYINNRLAVDLGGCHGPETGSVSLDASAAALNITVGGNYVLKIFNAERHTSGSNFGVQTSIKLVAPASVCGDGVITGSEQCDDGANNGKTCCDPKTCMFSNSTTVCRPVAGGCDIAETCTGSSNACPADTFKPYATPCGQLFGACDVQIERSCTGNSASCYEAPTAVNVLGTAFSDYNVISFNTYTCHEGDVEGRIAVRNNAYFDHYTAGLELTLAANGYKTITALVGGDATWTSGSIHPDGTAPTVSGPESYIYVGGNFTGAATAYLAAQYVGNVTAVASAFDMAQSYYSLTQADLASLPINVSPALMWGDGLQLTCNNKADNLYHVQVNATMFNKVNWYILKNCNFTSRWVIDIVGSENVTIKGQPFPGVVERVLYNIMGSGRYIWANNGVAGHILAPYNTFAQSVGVTYGMVIVGDVLIAKQNNLPNCKTYRPVAITSKLKTELTPETA